MITRTLVTALAVTASLVVAGCGSDPETSASPSSNKGMSASDKKALLQYSQCMRDHGVNFPDPQFGEGGRMQQRIGGPGSNVDPKSQKFRDAMTACQKEAPGGMMFGGGPSEDGK